MLILPTHLLTQIKAWDKSIDILFNSRIRRWIVVQKLPKAFRVPNKLRGVSTITGEYSNYKVMFVCETDDGIPVEPGPWIVRRLWEVAPMAQESRLIEERERLVEERKEREFQSQLSDICESTKSDLHTYGGISQYGGEDRRLAKKHIIIGSP